MTGVKSLYSGTSTPDGMGNGSNAEVLGGDLLDL
jgi:hypothetical protein